MTSCGRTIPHMPSSFFKIIFNIYQIQKYTWVIFKSIIKSMKNEKEKAFVGELSWFYLWGHQNNYTILKN